jgi:hypothetical protein
MRVAQPPLGQPPLEKPAELSAVRGLWRLGVQDLLVADGGTRAQDAKAKNIADAAVWGEAFCHARRIVTLSAGC